MMMQNLAEQEPLASFIQGNPAALLYFSADGCGVCTVLQPKIEALLEQEFPRVALGRLNCSQSPDLAAHYGVFTVPTLVLYFDGRETRRFARNVSLGQLREALARPYQLLFS